MFVNNSNAPISWYINLDDASQFIEDGTFQLLHRSGSPYKFAYNGDHIDFPTKMLGSGEMSSLGILFSPGIITLSILTFYENYVLMFSGCIIIIIMMIIITIKRIFIQDRIFGCFIVNLISSLTTQWTFLA